GGFSHSPNLPIGYCCQINKHRSQMRVQRYYIFFVPPNFSATFFKKYAYFLDFSCFWEEL
ncbi:hypothetical protein, partial [Prevotella sp. AM23-5]|uniref:hypothetical protein n=1 Tax=Prevotella sp. AM23-5 TaxID=2292054 RepID=UPI001F2D3E7A